MEKDGERKIGTGVLENDFASVMTIGSQESASYLQQDRGWVFVLVVKPQWLMEWCIDGCLTVDTLLFSSPMLY